MHPTAGKVICMKEMVHQRWRREFGGCDTDGDVVMEDLGEGTCYKHSFLGYLFLLFYLCYVP